MGAAWDVPLLLEHNLKIQDKNDKSFHFSFRSVPSLLSFIISEVVIIDHRLLVDAITRETTDWTCKVQVVDKFRPRESRNQSVHFQTIIVQDESEQQVSIVLYGDDILKYEKSFALFKTYFVSCAKVREPRSYSIRAGTYEWVVDRYTIVEAVTNNGGMELPLPAPRKLNTLPFSSIEHQHPGVQFDLLAVVANCSALQYTADQSKHFREAIVIDQSKKPFLFTIWDDLADNEGATLLHHLHEHPVILAKRIGVTEFRGALRLATRYQTTIITNPQYVQATTLMNWVKDNEQMLLSYILRSSSASPSSLNLAPIEDVLSISTIPELSSTVQTFPVEGKISLPDRPQSFYLLACSHCNHFVRSKTKKLVRCFNCKLERMLVPRCHFELDIMDASDTITAMVSETLAETMLSLTAEQIYESVVAQKEPLSITHINHQLAQKLFKLQLQKPVFRFPDQKPGMLAVASFTEAETPVFGTLPLSMTPGEAGKKQKIEPPTPTKKA